MVRTPCIGTCSTVFGDDVCRGCKRFVHEIIDWNSYSDSQKLAIDLRLQSLMAQLLRARFVVLDEGRLRQMLELNRIPFRRERMVECWIYDLLRSGVPITDWQDFGLRLFRSSPETSAQEIFRAVDAEFFILSEAHYHRYLREPIRMLDQKEEQSVG